MSALLADTESFSRLFPVAHSQCLRVIALNKRDYKGSTLYSADELAALCGSDCSTEDAVKAQEAFWGDRGREIALFLMRLTKKENIPKMNKEGNKGGIVLLAWSLGSLTTLAFLANLRTYSTKAREILSSHLCAFLIYGKPAIP